MKHYRILIYVLIYVLNIALVFLIAHALGFHILAAAGGKRIYIYLGIAAALFYFETYIYNQITQSS